MRKGILQPNVLRGLAAVAEARQDWKGAQQQLEAWLKLEPTSSDALQQLAQCLFNQKDEQGALKKLKEAAKADPKLLTPEALLARYYEAVGDQTNTKKWMTAALAQAPKNPATHLAAGEWALRTGDLQEAQKQAVAALNIDPKSLKAKIFRGAVALFQKDYRNAETYFESAHIQAPHDFAAQNNLAIALIEQTGDPDYESKKSRALDFAQNCVSQNPNEPEAYSTLGWVLFRLGQRQKAADMLKQAVSGGQFSQDTAYYIACAAVDRNQLSDAVQWLEIALKNPGAFVMRAEAKALLEKLRKDEPKK
jgi:tetratricopeptide (TPR) repeat protein